MSVMSKSIFGSFFFLDSENVGVTLGNTCLVPNELNLANLKKSDHPFA
jgi:hypothetical protein